MSILRLIEYEETEKQEVINAEKYNKLVDTKTFFKVIRRWEV